jgi:hypothetical protein
LDDLSGTVGLPRLRAASADAVARDGESALKLVELSAVNPDRLLHAPAKPIDPGRILEGDALGVGAPLENNFNPLFFARGSEDLLRRIIRHWHGPYCSLQDDDCFGKFHPTGAKLKSNFIIHMGGEGVK